MATEELYLECHAVEFPVLTNNTFLAVSFDMLNVLKTKDAWPLIFEMHYVSLRSRLSVY